MRGENGAHKRKYKRFGEQRKKNDVRETRRRRDREKKIKLKIREGRK